MNHEQNIEVHIDGHTLIVTPKTGREGTQYYEVSDNNTAEEYNYAPEYGFSDPGIQQGGLSEELVEKAVKRAQRRGF